MDSGAVSVLGHSDWKARLRGRLLDFGIRTVCRSSDLNSIGPSAAADVPLLTAAPRYIWLRILENVGVKSITATSALGHRFVCHIGDLAEFPYYHRRALAPELALCAAWLREANEPVIYDVGANVGFFATQLSQMLAARHPTIYAFEPVPRTFAKLVVSVQQLGLHHSVKPVAAAVFDSMTIVDVTSPTVNSLLSQIGRGHNGRVTGRIDQVPAVCLDAFSAKLRTPPILIKLDVEGSESAALRGAQHILDSSDPPAIALEFSPQMLAECGDSVDDIVTILSGYSFRYIDDIVGQRRPYGSAIDSLHELDWTCNLFAVPSAANYSARVSSAFDHARRSLGLHR